MIHAYDVDGVATGAEAFNQIALDPNSSVVVRACAGSGKTWLLTSRIIRLLLEGAAPNQILAITFTKKAAQEMRDRVVSILSVLADGSERTAIDELMVRGLTREDAYAMLPKARGLYDAVLGAGQEIPIHTFHAWFYRLLQAAPIGSGIKRNVLLAEDVDELKKQAWDQFYTSLNQQDSIELRENFLWLIQTMGDANTYQVLDQALNNATELMLFEQKCAAQNLDILNALALEISVDTGLDVHQGDASAYAAWSETLHHNHALDVLIRALSCGNAEKQKRAEHLQRILTINEPLKQWQALSTLLVADGTRLNATLFKTDAKQRQVMEANLSIEQYETARQAVDEACGLLQKQLADCESYALNSRLIPCAQALLRHYQDIKSNQGKIDFSDVERLCFQLVQNEHSAAYIQVQLDARYKHLLFDEFQDTNPLQWHIINSWLSAYDFDSLRPTVFLVGDVKQSIYRFRKADARVFDEAQSLLVSRYRAKVLRTHATRRNSHAVVCWVNAMFEQPDYQLLDFSAHHTFNQDVGHVGVLGLSEQEAESLLEEEGSAARHWLTRPQHVIEATARDDESYLIIEAIQRLVGRYPVKDEASGNYRAARYSDVMLLVNNRTHLSGYERLLRQAHIPFISSKRGGLMATLEALDLMALLQWLMNVDDDMALLHVLRTPIFDVSDHDLQFLLRHRDEQMISYWRVLQKMNELPSVLQQAKVALSQWAFAAPTMSPHDVLDRIYNEAQVFKKYAQRVPNWLNAQVQANLRAFLQLALSVNSGRYPSLSTFLVALQCWQAQETEGLSEAEPMGMGDAVRIMTVHGAKGLEAPIVMLIDMKSRNAKNDNFNTWLIDWPPHEMMPNHLSWVGKKENTGLWRAHRFSANTSRAEIEKLNLCYVAMTRARQLLLVSAAQLKQDSVENTHDKGLYGALSLAIQQVPSELVLPASISEWQWATDFTIDENVNTQANVIENRWSDILAQEQLDGLTVATQADQSAAQLGIAWHGVLEYATENAGQMLPLAQIVARFGVTYSQADEAQKLAQKTLSHPDCRHWFDAAQYDEAFNELSLISPVGKTVRVDRLVRCGSEITVIDYKLSWTDEDLSSYQRQLSEYIDLLRLVYPSEVVKGVLLSAAGSMVKVL